MMSYGPRSYLAALDPLPAPTPPRPPTLIGPDRWWNPLSPSWPPTAAGRAAYQAAREKTARVAAEVEARVEAAAVEAAKVQIGVDIDPIVVAETVVGKPSWGYYLPTVAVGLVTSAALVAGGAYAYNHRNTSKRRK